MSCCKEKMCIVYTKEQQENLRLNPNVESVNGNRLILTYSHRQKVWHRRLLRNDCLSVELSHSGNDLFPSAACYIIRK